MSATAVESGTVTVDRATLRDFILFVESIVDLEKIRALDEATGLYERLLDRVYRYEQDMGMSEKFATEGENDAASIMREADVRRRAVELLKIDLDDRYAWVLGGKAVGDA
jgi:hypothetical protein